MTTQSRINVGRVRARIKELEDERVAYAEKAREIDAHIDELKLLLKEVANVSSRKQSN